MIAPLTCGDVRRSVAFACLAHSVDLLEERITEILRLVSSYPWLEAKVLVGTAAARAEVNVDQIRRHLGELGIVLPETTEPE